MTVQDSIAKSVQFGSWALLMIGVWRRSVDLVSENRAAIRKSLSPLSYLIWGEKASRTIDENLRRNAAEGRIAGVMLVAERG